MNTKDVEEIRLRLQTVQYQLGKMHTLATIYQAGAVSVADENMPLVAQQKTGIKDKFYEVRARIAKVADKLEEATGTTGTVNQHLLEEIQEASARIFRAIKGAIESAQEIEKLLPGLSPVDADGNITPFELDPQVTQQTADTLATLRAAAAWWIQQEAAKLT